MRDPTIDFLNIVLDDIRNERVEVYRYRLLGKSVFDFKLKSGGQWEDYPRPEYISKYIIKKFGKSNPVGTLRSLSDS
jgi:hypothetical protein